MSASKSASGAAISSPMALKRSTLARMSPKARRMFSDDRLVLLERRLLLQDAHGEAGREPRLAVRDLFEAGHDLEQGGLAHAVGPHHAYLRAGEERQRDVVQDDLVAMRLARLVHLVNELWHKRAFLAGRVRGARGAGRAGLQKLRSLSPRTSRAPRLLPPAAFAYVACVHPILASPPARKARSAPNCQETQKRARRMEGARRCRRVLFPRAPFCKGGALAVGGVALQNVELRLGAGNAHVVEAEVGIRRAVHDDHRPAFEPLEGGYGG